MKIRPEQRAVIMLFVLSQLHLLVLPAAPLTVIREEMSCNCLRDSAGLGSAPVPCTKLYQGKATVPTRPRYHAREPRQGCDSLQYTVGRLHILFSTRLVARP